LFARKYKRPEKEWVAKKKLAREKEESQKAISLAVQENGSPAPLPDVPSPEVKAPNEQLISP
jgi:hypothetical protein